MLAAILSVKHTVEGKMKFIFIYIPVCSDRYLVYKKKVYGYRERARSIRTEAFIDTIALLSRTTLKA